MAAKIGDIIEIETKKGFAYAQYTHKKQRYGAVIRALPGFFKERPNSFAELVKQKAQFTTLFPLNTAVRQKIVSIVANVDVPLEAKQFPIFRSGMPNPKTNKVEVWWLWDGEKEWRVDRLTPEQREYPILGVWNDTLLIERIESGWTSEMDPR